MSAPIGQPPVGVAPVAGFAEGGGPLEPDGLFDWFQTVISQYANSPILLRLIANMAEYLDPTARFDAFFNLVWNVDTARNHGLDVWGRIVGVERVLQVTQGDYFGFDEATDAEPFNQAPFFHGAVATANFRLSDAAFRKLILAKALANITDGSIPAINQILINLFPGYGNCYVTDNGDMTLTYTFGDTLSPVDRSIVYQSGVLPKPLGVRALVSEA